MGILEGLLSDIGVLTRVFTEGTKTKFFVVFVFPENIL